MGVAEGLGRCKENEGEMAEKGGRVWESVRKTNSEETS